MLWPAAFAGVDIVPISSYQCLLCFPNVGLISQISVAQRACNFNLPHTLRRVKLISMNCIDGSSELKGLLSQQKGNDMEKIDIDIRVQELESDITLLSGSHVYELEKTIGVAKCSTLASRMQKNLDAIVEGYNSLIDKHEAAVDREQFDLLSGLLVALAKEISSLSNKQPDGLVNVFKVTQINRVLKPLKEIMKSEPSTNFLDVLVDPEPDSKTDKTRNTYSDTAVILSQFREACGEYRSKHYKDKWKIDL